MPRQSITFTSPNDDWLKAQVDSQEYSNKSDVVNDLIRKARSQQAQIEAIRTALIEGEKSGISDRTPDDIMKAVIEKKCRNGVL
jgi:antitoxin ParD1/3/4